MVDAASFRAMCAVEGREGGGCEGVERGGHVARSSQLSQDIILISGIF